MAQLGLIPTRTPRFSESINPSGPAYLEPSWRGGVFCDDLPQGQEGLGGLPLGLLHSSPNQWTPGMMGSISSSMLSKMEVWILFVFFFL